MKALLICIILAFGHVQSDFIHPQIRPYHETLEEFESEFGVVIDDEIKDETADILAKIEDQINTNNEKYDRGESSYWEKLWPQGVEPKAEFESEMEGIIVSDPEGDRMNGAIPPTIEEMNEPINLAKVREMYNSPEMNRESYPDQLDLRKMHTGKRSGNTVGWVTDPRNQYNCGSCAAFATLGMVESCFAKVLSEKAAFTVAGMEYLLTYAHLDLSEQYLVDCGYDGKSMLACKGAYSHAYGKWLVKDGGIVPNEYSYPYLDRYPNKHCNVAKDLPKWNVVKLTDTKTDHWCNADKMKKLVATKGAVVATMYASDWSFNQYGGDVYKECSSQVINHAVLVVGYGTNAQGEDYWIVKNSWGTNWGDNGFFKIRRGTNECGIEMSCVVADCEWNHTPGPQPTGTPAPRPVPNPTYPTNLFCDMTNHYKGQKVTGDALIIRIYNDDGTVLRSYVNCKDSICTPHNPGPSNACMYICNKLEC